MRFSAEESDKDRLSVDPWRLELFFGDLKPLKIQPGRCALDLQIACLMEAVSSIIIRSLEELSPEPADP